MDHRTAILNLIYSYSRYVDEGNFEAVGQLYAQGVYEVPSVDRNFPGTGIGEYFAQTLRRFEDGTPKTTHVNPNVILDIDDQAGRASAWTLVMVFQEVEARIDCIFSGWYDDDFELDGDRWVWKRRTAHRRLMGDMSHHVMAAAAAE